MHRRVSAQPEPATAERRAAVRSLERAIRRQTSRSIGVPDAGRLANGVLLPREGVRFSTWNPVDWMAPNGAHGATRAIASSA